MTRTFVIRSLFVAGLSLLVACGGGGGASTGTLVLGITDAPFPGLDCLAAANVTVWRVEVKGEEGFVEIPVAAPAPEEGTEGPGEDPAAPKPPDDAVGATYDLLDLTGGLTALLGEGEVPAGTYTEVRLHLLDAELEFQPEGDGEEAVTFDPQPFKVPSGMSSGLKIKIDPPLLLAPGQVGTLTLDVDLAESFHTTGLGGTPTCDELRAGETMVIFRPVVRALNESETGLVTGTVRDETTATGIPSAEIAAIRLDGSSEDAPVEPTEETGTEGPDFAGAPKVLAAEDGAYAILLEAGEYDLYVRAAGYAEDWTLALEGLVVAAGTILAEQDVSLVPVASEAEEPAPTTLVR